tara:strand:+ start:1542 stop:1829 length:288 start_codon:yes stop_codon:yes gene_type:complete
MRYNKATIKRDMTGSRYQSTTIVPKIPLNSNDQYIEVSVTDRLDLISHAFYGTRNYWWVIAAANNIGKGTLAIQEGAILRLPSDPAAIANRLTGY